MFKNILVPYDGSKCSLHAYKVALEIGKKFHSKVTVVTCLERDFRTPLYPDSRVSNEILKKQKEAVDKNMDRLNQIAKRSKMSIKSKTLVVQSIVKSLLAHAKSNRIDLIVMGSHGRTGFDKLLLGSVANGVSQKATCPVIIVK